MNISIGCDHAGFEYKEKIIAYLIKKGYKITDYGTDSSESVDYPDFVHPVAKKVSSGRSKFGIVICGSANGVAMTANKHKKIRAAICWTPEIAKMARQHNNANVLAIPARFIDMKTTNLILRKFLSTDFEGGRHKRRVNKISKC